MAPEVLLHKNLAPSPHADVFSFGRVLYFILTGQTPLSKIDVAAIKTLAKSCRVHPLLWPEVGNGGYVSHAQSRSLCEDCTAFDPSMRPGIVTVHQALVSHTWSDSSTTQELVCAEATGSTISLQVVLKQARESAGRVTLEDRRPVLEANTKKICRNGIAANSSKQPDRAITALTISEEASQPSTLVLPAFAPTPNLTQILAVEELLLGWNFRVLSDSCCSYHAGLCYLQDVVAQQRLGQCRVHKPHDFGQCPKCGIMLEHIETDQPGLTQCYLCGGSISVNPSGGSECSFPGNGACRSPLISL
eukprot:gnl/TRDRNA2_/TRDRNA2_169912_c0_seq2.p1 gnl/TRDRNA2_/TRDRNA2_169912_c0~~gnl/TRDRNA2_/TRDRNA2_169912_c0_seq2.p1  ORF type:complete len:321 (+),score=12.32 gnl/TRDRNA2_/TRDRNA2_169912_c0_seq2:52-963(+)